MTSIGSGSGWFRANVNAVGKLCTDLNLTLWHNPLPRYPNSMGATARGLQYREEWGLYQSNSLFDIRLADGALLQFKEQPNDNSILSYSYLECPYIAMSYSDYIMDRLSLASDPDFVFWEDYESYVVQCDLRSSVTPVRYDYSPALYREGVHPASHLHFGYRSEVRLSCRRMLRPLSFFLFIVRQYYPFEWEKAFFLLKDAPTLVRQVREDLNFVPADMFKNRDFWELYLD